MIPPKLVLRGRRRGQNVGPGSMEKRRGALTRDGLFFAFMWSNLNCSPLLSGLSILFLLLLKFSLRSGSGASVLSLRQWVGGHASLRVAISSFLSSSPSPLTPLSRNCCVPSTRDRKRRRRRHGCFAIVFIWETGKYFAEQNLVFPHPEKNIKDASIQTIPPLRFVSHARAPWECKIPSFSLEMPPTPSSVLRAI